VSLAQQGCDRGNGDDCRILYSAYDEGNGVPKDPGKAEVFAKRGAAAYQAGCTKGTMSDCTSAGVDFENGFGVPKDLARAATFFKKACDAGEQGSCIAFQRVKGAAH
jgi:TPR repeat protein